MRPWGRYLACTLAGLAIGCGGALAAVKAGALGANAPIGAWTTGRDFGTARASAYTRAVVALYGLLALPASEARYYTAMVDDAGQPLDGRCRYRVTGGALPAAWWSLTLYDKAGYLVANPAGIYSVGSLGLPAGEQANWSVLVGPQPRQGHWLPSDPASSFALTLRAYLPNDGGRGNLTAAELPHIVREGC
jgi:hypothetical protein